ncbi:hypothetical protein V8E54_006275 [Elaphomyces granulatus]
MASAVDIIRSDLATLNRHVREFGKRDSNANLEEVDLSETLRKIESHAPNTFFLLEHAADNQRSRTIKNEYNNRIISLIAILSVGRARNSANFLTKSLGLLGITESYDALRKAAAAIKQQSQDAIARLKNEKSLCIAYDNFQYYQHAGAQRLGDVD